jgi:hypothetical protein
MIEGGESMSNNRKTRRKMLFDPIPFHFCERCGAEQVNNYDGRPFLSAKIDHVEKHESSDPKDLLKPHVNLGVNEDKMDEFDDVQYQRMRIRTERPCLPVDCETCEQSVQSWFSKSCKPSKTCGHYQFVSVESYVEYKLRQSLIL